MARSKARSAFGQGSGLVDDEGVDLAQILDRRGIAEQHAVRGAPTRRDHDGHGCGQTQGAGQAMISTATALIRPKTQRGSGPEEAPTEEASAKQCRPRAIDEVAGHHIGHALHRCLGTLRLATICTICDRTVAEPTRSLNA
jgi:hypothetical protein